jgi:hypothetical protein
MPRTSLLPLALLLISCSKKDIDCSTEGQDNWAFQFSFESAPDGSCPFEGTLKLEGELDVEPLECKPKGDDCYCEGGNEYGTYRITLTNTDTDVTEDALIEVMRAPAPACIELDVIEPFSLGGAGGAGGEAAD